MELFEIRRMTSQLIGEQFLLRDISLPIIEKAVPLHDRVMIISINDLKVVKALSAQSNLKMVST
jgi:hypothetical protein